MLLTLDFVERRPAIGLANPTLPPPIAAKKEMRGSLGRGKLRSHFVQVAAYMSTLFASSLSRWEHQGVHALLDPRLLQVSAPAQSVAGA
jgi:hypothetical protein